MWDAQEEEMWGKSRSKPGPQPGWDGWLHVLFPLSALASWCCSSAAVPEHPQLYGKRGEKAAAHIASASSAAFMIPEEHVIYKLFSWRQMLLCPLSLNMIPVLHIGTMGQWVTET